MTRKVFKSGNSIVVTLPPDLLARYNIREGTEVDIREDSEHGGILITPAAPRVLGVDENFADQLTELIEQYRSALVSLAKR
jgi:antitoxin MazE